MAAEVTLLRVKAFLKQNQSFYFYKNSPPLNEKARMGKSMGLGQVIPPSQTYN
ncbi:MAG: hypothetical protein HOF21_13580 [Nitrospina sp.]|jgi:hypothetical protein|nr:hypothetical protein [Nitrospina sp.]MBT5632970.1 hypothetical protein [Nitrospina sp.]